MITGSVSGVIIIGLTAATTYESSKNDVLGIVENDARRIGSLLVEKQKQYLFSGDGKSISLNDRERHKLERETNSFLKSFDIIKIKIFDLSQTIIYSNEKSIIGIKDKHSINLKKALKGEVVSNLEAKDEMTDLSQENLSR